MPLWRCKFQRLGAVLLQDEKPLACASRALTPTQQREKTKRKGKGNPCNCVLGAEMSSVHLWKNNRRWDRPQAIAAYLKQALHEAPLRLQKMMLILQRYDLKVRYVPGSELSVAVALNKAYLEETKESLTPDLEVDEAQLTPHLPISQERWIPASYCRWSNPASLEHSSSKWMPLSQTGATRYQMKFQKLIGLLFKAQKLTVPQSKRKEM